ncbi:hypothetical protein GOBAR_AA33544 [Gossypium barbadense]|uniref:Shikimate O-hydroxycinnamoyltransferase n=1 Tax=Gossypium barbadense TaxID=3634 RepID=A0A2P5W7S7_GOSBA|nr:hypothetical protein GOBAR_AA33544 [Gossypium barbadense]
MARYHLPTIYYYKPNGSSDFFDTGRLKEALSKILVPFYPIAGRLGYDENGRLEIICNAEGVLFVEAETTSVMEHLIGFQHTLGDGTAALHFISSWVNTSRGLSPTIAPFIDRTPIRARDPPAPKFHHVENDPSPVLKFASKSQSNDHKPSIVSTFKLTADQLNTLKAKANVANANCGIKYISFNILVAHIWRCVSKARVSPPIKIPSCVFQLMVDINWILLSHKATSAISAPDYSEKMSDLNTLVTGPRTFRCPNLPVVSWIWLPKYEADFRWVRSIYMGPGNVVHEGKIYILPSPVNDESLSLVTRLEIPHMKAFEKLLYEF